MSNFGVFLKDFCLCNLGAAALLVLIYFVADIACFAGARGILRATRDEEAQPQVIHRFSPLVIKLVNPDGETLEATAVFEGATTEERKQNGNDVQ